MKDFEPRLCDEAECEMRGQHFENCESCWGFGFASHSGHGGTFRVKADEASAFMKNGVRPLGSRLLANCEVCGSGILGARVKPLPE